MTFRPGKFKALMDVVLIRYQTVGQRIAAISLERRNRIVARATSLRHNARTGEVSAKT